MSKRPYIQWYIGEWKKDPAINKCSPSTRGIWFDFLCDMHEEQSGGVLTCDKDALCRIGRCSRVELDRALDELAKTRAAEVSQRGESVTVINRRMKRESDLSTVRSESGAKGIAKRQQNAEDEVASEIGSVEWMQSPEFEKVWYEWIQHRLEIKRAATPMAMLQQIRQLKTWGCERSIAALRHSIANGWQGVFEPQNSIKPSGNGHRTRYMIEQDIKSVKAQRDRLTGVRSYDSMAREYPDRVPQYQMLTAKIQQLNNELGAA